jgi:hypothetical protein
LCEQYLLLRAGLDAKPFNYQGEETFTVGAEIHLDFRNGQEVPVGRRYADGVLCRGDDELGTVVRGATEYPGEIGRSISVMVRKTQRRADPYTAFSKFTEKALGPGNSRESNGLPVRKQISGKGWTASCKTDARHRVPTGKNRYSREKMPEPIFERRSMRTFARMCDHESIRSLKISDGFAERARGQDESIPERAAAVEKNDVEIALQPKMLETVVEYQHVRSTVP